MAVRNITAQTMECAARPVIFYPGGKECLVLGRNGRDAQCWIIVSMQESDGTSNSEEQSTGAANSMAVMRTMAQRHASIDDSFHLPNFPHMAWVNPSALPNDSNHALAKSPTRVHFNFIVL